MSEDHKASSVSFMPNDKDDDIEENGGITATPDTSSSSPTTQEKDNHMSYTTPTSDKITLRHTNSSRLSALSKKYDINGDGVLDETEQAMRDMDKSGRGHLSNKVVYALLKEQVELQRQLLNKKRIILFLAVFAIVLALANMGTAFAAARLAQDTTTENNVLVTTGSHPQTVATNSHADVFSFESTLQKDPQRQLIPATQFQIGQLETMAKSLVVEIVKRCATGQAVQLQRLRFVGTPYATTLNLYLGPTLGTLNPTVQLTENDFMFQFPGGKYLDLTCGPDTCQASGTALLLELGMPCMPGECESGYCFNADRGAFLLPNAPGRCTCHPQTNTGCVGTKTCMTHTAIQMAQGVSHASPRCLLDTNEVCTGNYECLSYNCRNVDSKCGCNELTNYGCFENESCHAVNGGDAQCVTLSAP